MSNQENIEYHDTVKEKFSETVYQNMVQERYGIETNCAEDPQKWSIKHSLLQLTAIKDGDVAVIECP